MSTVVGRRTTGRRTSRRPLYGLLAAMLVAHTGTRVSAVAFPWFVLATTGSATKTGLVAFAELAPYVVSKALTGPWIDRIGGRTVSWTTDLVSAAAAFAIVALHLAGALSLPAFLGLVAVIGAARGPGDNAKEVMIPEAAERCGVPLERATGLSGTVERLASTVGPAVAGLLIGVSGPVWGVAVNGATFVLGSILVALALPRGMGGPPSEETDADADAQGDTAEAGPTSYLRRLAEGVAVLRRDRLMLTICVMIALTNLLDIGWSSVLLPVWVHDEHKGAGFLGLALTTMSAGAIVGSLVASAWAHRLPRRPVFFVGFLLVGAPRFVALALDAPTPVLLAVLAVGGLGSGFLNPILSAVFFERVPRRLYGRVGALLDAMAWSAMPFGGILAGALIAGLGVSPALVVCGVAYATITVAASLRPEWREMDRARARGDSPTVTQ